jgi:hypothetical protein
MLIKEKPAGKSRTVRTVQVGSFKKEPDIYLFKKRPAGFLFL